MKLEVGMYVRTKKGIFQIRNKDVFIEDKKQYIGVNGRYTCIDIETIEKASHNIIDLIEEDDLIKCRFGEQILILQVGARYTTAYPEKGWIKGVFTQDGEFWSLETLEQEDILQSIITKEQYESCMYKVGE